MADLLLGHVHALLSHAETAMEYSNRAFAYFTSHASEPWELAFAHAVQANAAHASSDAKLHRESYAKALEIADTLTDPEDRKVLDATLNVIPKPASLRGAD